MCTSTGPSTMLRRQISNTVLPFLDATALQPCTRHVRAPHNGVIAEQPKRCASTASVHRPFWRCRLRLCNQTNKQTTSAFATLPEHRNLALKEKKREQLYTRVLVFQGSWTGVRVFVCTVHSPPRSQIVSRPRSSLHGVPRPSALSVHARQH